MAFVRGVRGRPRRPDFCTWCGRVAGNHSIWPHPAAETGSVPTRVRVIFHPAGPGFPAASPLSGPPGPVLVNKL